MKDTEQARFDKLTAGPTTATWHGCMTRVAMMGLADRWFLAHHLRCDTEDLAKMLHRRLNQTNAWCLSSRGDRRSRRLADLYYRRPIGSGPEQFVPPGKCVVLLTPNADALWVSSWSAAGYVRHAWPGAWRCTAYQNAGSNSDPGLIRDAVAATKAIWGFPPEAGMVVFINPKTCEPDTEAWYKEAGFVSAGQTKGGLHVLQMLPDAMPAPNMPQPKVLQAPPIGKIPYIGQEIA